MVDHRLTISFYCHSHVFAGADASFLNSSTSLHTSTIPTLALGPGRM